MATHCSIAPRFGCERVRVHESQAALHGQGFPYLKEAGVFGRDILQALMTWQRKRVEAASADGVAGPNTAGELGLAWPGTSKNRDAFTLTSTNPH